MPQASRHPPASLKAGDLAPVLALLKKANASVAAAFPGETGDRQPVHTVYGGAHLFGADSTRKLGAAALDVLDEYAPDAPTFARALGLQPAELADTIRTRVVEKLRHEPRLVIRDS